MCFTHFGPKWLIETYQTIEHKLNVHSFKLENALVSCVVKELVASYSVAFTGWKE